MTELEINPYESPQSLEAIINSDSKLTFRIIRRTLLLGILAGLFLGAATNCINGAIHPVHFSRFASRYGVKSDWIAAILQGSAEGAAYGLGNAVALIGFSVILPSRFRLTDKLSRIVFMSTLVVIAFWLIGGVAGLATQHRPKTMPSPFWYENHLDYGSNEFRWVVWSMNFSIFGSPLATLMAYLWNLQRYTAEPAP